MPKLIGEPFANFEVGRLIKKTKMEISAFGNFLYVIVVVYFTYLKVLLCIKIVVGHVICLKGLFESSEPFLCLG